ncbi:stabilin-2 isoform X1 [Xiphophorus couchianus]|uniref:stabilin-2 isoform X1 n=2 Tax=Xiphophorus couchianus TaxID=32473 RepID=UPI001015DC5B|nr:stabilin-2 isoform X1 [Xiphophorus couchianus]
MEVLLSFQLLVLMMTAVASQQNFCSNSTVLRTQTACHSCSISMFVQCPTGFRRSPESLASGCKYQIRTSSLQLAVRGCSFQCFQQVEMKSCCPGYWGPDCTECPDGADRPCSGRGVCSDGLGGNGTCSCQVGFVGTVCEDCSPGRYGPTCSSECSCVHGLCGSGLKGDGRCTCFSGYRGPRCDQELPECAALSCQQNSRCMEEALTGRLVCQCLPGYEKSGSQCLAKNPCLRPVCHSLASCAHTGPDQHHCTCNEGYSGDGQVCMPIDPCQTQNGRCSARTTRCIYDGPGKSHCECLPGFETLADGSCNLKDVCKPDSCHQNANCSTVGPGRVRCACLQGYIGNGKVCFGNIMERLRELNTQPGKEWSGQLSNAISLFDSLSWPLQNLGPFTVFVPVNRGFKGTSIQTLTADSSKAKYLCKMHLVAGSMPSSTLMKTDVFYTLSGKAGETEMSGRGGQIRIRIHGSRKRGEVIKSDLAASNGLVHIITKLMDSVPATVESRPDENLMKIISDYGKLETFKSLLEQAELASVMDLPQPVTVFTPTTEAFNSMKEGHLQFLRSTEGRSKLTEFLRNHIVPSTSLEVYNIVSSPTIVTMANQVLIINVTENGQILVNGAAVLEAAVEAKNGRLYVMNGVLTPPSIQPLLPHRCDITETKIIKGECVSCAKVHLFQCSSGVYTDTSYSGCLYNLFSDESPIKVPFRGCTPLCTANVTTPACCKGFYGPDCSPCPGGFNTPCSGRGQCVEGIRGNGSCICEPNFRGSRCQYCSSFNKYGPNCDRTCPCVHGQCDNRPDSDGRCKLDSCLRGFTGRFCERQTSVCGGLAQFCHAHADCDFTDGSPRCVCKAGFQGDGITCVESDPCAPPLRGGCSVNAKCIKTGPGTHTCQCLTGWTEDGNECQPINNCDGPDGGGCHPNASCIYVGPGQSDCACKAGYMGNGHTCEAVNQCVTANGGCHFRASCLLLSSQWTCVCDDGYAGDGLLCYGTVDQELMVLQNASDFFRWTMDSGLSHSLSDQNLTLLVPTSAAVAQMSPMDRSFWTMKGNLPSLIRNHVLPGVFSSSTLRNISSVTSLLTSSLPVSTSQEITSVGGATVIASDSAATNGLIHLINKVLVPDKKLSEGLLAVLALRPEFSLFRSYLIEYNLTKEIERAEEFTVFAPTDSAITQYLQQVAAPALDSNMTRYHVVLAERLLKTDLQPGGYRETLLGFPFQIGIYPRDGKLFVNDAQINSSNLLCGKGVIHGLSAVLHINRNRCDKLTYSKVKGSCGNCLLPKTQKCPSGTDHDKSVRMRSCLYRHTIEGESHMTIGCIATCLRKNIERRCCEGFFGEHCEPCPGPKGQACFGNGLCSDGVNGTGVCKCNKDFHGTACESCQSGKYGVHCDQDCRCKNGLCNEGLNGDGTCECDVGWRGVRCDEKIESKADELCGSVKCHSSANCAVQTSGSQCLCAAGFEGNGTFCKAVDPCLVKNGGCSLSGVCKRTRPGSRDCVCGRGYAGDGFVCVEINPCLEGNGGCHAKAECIHVGPNKTLCVCSKGYSGDGQNCTIVNLCAKKNGGCHHFAQCNMTGPGIRTCTCSENFVGDGFKCKSTVDRELRYKGSSNFYFSLVMMEITLKGRGPFTVFAPNAQAIKSNNSLVRAIVKHRETFANVLRGHIVMCHTLLPDDLYQTRNLTSLSGFVLTTRSTQGKITINEANLTNSDDISVNGIIHEIDSVLLPPNLNRDNILLIPNPTEVNLTDVAERHGYKTFYKLLKDTGVMDLIDNVIFHPVTIFLPSDDVMASLPQQQKDFLFHQQNRAQLQEYLKYHVMISQKVYAEGLIYLESGRTLQGSALSFSCGGPDKIGEIYVNDGSCRITERHLVFRAGIAYGIDCLLIPPSLGGRCDEQTVLDLKMNCGPCTRTATLCPRGTVKKEVENCDLPTLFVSKNSGCQPTCTINFWHPKCCSGFYGRNCLVCPGGVHSPCSNRGKCDDGHLGTGTCTCDTGFKGTACEMCREGFYGPGCKACNCSDHGSCDDRLQGTGLCFCEEGWTGEQCDIQQTEVFQCSPACSSKAVCQENNTCICRPFHVGDGVTCTVVDMCKIWNGGCAREAKCSQREEKVSCTCPQDHSGDGFTCLPVDPCASGDNGGCSEHATCTMTAPGKKRCTCKDNYMGDGVSCELKQLPISRCLLDNGGCHPDATCTDLHFEDATLGVFHYRSAKGQYKLDYTAAQQGCRAEGATLANYTQLSYAQQGGLNMCAAGWLDQARVAYPTTYFNPNCGFGHVGIVDYGTRKNLSETWDAFCYRMKEVLCVCKPGYIGDGLICTGNLLQVLRSTPTFSNFLIQILKYSEVSESGRRFVKSLSKLEVQSTLFVPENSGLPENLTLSPRDIEFHLSEGQALPLSQLKNNSQIRTRVGSLSVLGVANLLSPSALASCFINDRFVTDSDIRASNGIIHVLQGPLEAPPPRPDQMHSAHQAGMGVGVVLLILLVVGAIFVGCRFYHHSSKPFQFHYFKDDDREEEPAAETTNYSRSISNPVYEAGPEPAVPEPSRSNGSGPTGSLEPSVQVEDRQLNLDPVCRVRTTPTAIIHQRP